MSRVYQRGGRFWLDFTNAEGKRQRKPCGDDITTEAQAAALLDKVLSLKAAGLDTDTGPLTVRRYAARWLQNRNRLDVGNAVKEESHLRLHILPHLGDVVLAELRPRHVLDLVRKLEQTKRLRRKAPTFLAPRTVRHIYGTLRSLLGDALVDGLVPLNACTLRPHHLPPDIDRDPAWREAAVFSRQEIVKLVSDPRIMPATACSMRCWRWLGRG